MKKFISKTALFILTFISLFFLFILFVPVTPRDSKSLLFAEIKKDSLLIHAKSPRIIFVGGSNLSFGLNSQMIKDSLNMNVINTAIHANLGLKYMLGNTFQHVKQGDIIVLAPEYSHFYRAYESGSDELLRIVLDVDKSKIRLLNFKQMINCMPYLGNFIHSKFDPKGYINIKESDVYSVNSFNQFGDVGIHWDMRRIEFEPLETTNPDLYEYKVMRVIKKWEQKIRKKEAILLISYPSFQDISFRNSLDAIKRIEREYEKNGFLILGTPDRYMMPDSLMFNTPYHLNKIGVDRRTKLLIEDLKKRLFL